MLDTFHRIFCLAYHLVYLLILLWSHLNFTSQGLAHLVIVTVAVTLLLDMQLVDPFFSTVSWLLLIDLVTELLLLQLLL